MEKHEAIISITKPDDETCITRHRFRLLELDGICYMVHNKHRFGIDKVIKILHKEKIEIGTGYCDDGAQS